jgi:hypothetical protein
MRETDPFDELMERRLLAEMTTGGFMSEQMRPASKKNPPDPTTHFDRQHPEHEAGAGKLIRNAGETPVNRPDQMEAAVSNRRERKELKRDPNPGLNLGPAQPDDLMKEEEPLGWDQAPQDVHSPRDKRHPRTEGKGGTP